MTTELTNAVPRNATHPEPLSQRELAVLTGISEGKSNGQIGRELYLSEDTIKTHARRLFRKLGVKERSAAVTEGFRAGLLHGAMLMDIDVLGAVVEEAARTRREYADRFVARNIHARADGCTPEQTRQFRETALAWWNEHHPALVAFVREYESRRTAVAS